jgi:pilus assembly protein FimV
MLSKRLTCRTSALALLALALGGPLRAAELGEVKVNSHIGQQLSADIELVDLTVPDLAELQARLANPDVFKGAGLEIPPELGGLNIAIAKRENKRFLHLTTLQPVKAEALHLFLELSAGGRQTIRATSLWLTPEPPAQRAARMAEAPPAPTPVPAPAPAPAATAAPAAPAPVAAFPASGEAGLNEAAQRAYAYRKQRALELAQARAAGQEAAPAPAASPVSVAAPAPLASPAGVSKSRPGAPSQSCAPAKQVEAQFAQCQAMTSKLADIEGKVRHLQTSFAAAAPSAIKAAAPDLPAPAPKTEAVAVKPAAPATKPATAPAKPGATPVKPGVAADLAGNPRSRLLMIAAGALAGLAALGGTIYFLRKRQVKGPLKIWQSFRKKDAAEVLEPAPEAAEQLAAQ